VSTTAQHMTDGTVYRRPWQLRAVSGEWSGDRAAWTWSNEQKGRDESTVADIISMLCNDRLWPDNVSLCHWHLL